MWILVTGFVITCLIIVLVAGVILGEGVNWLEFEWARKKFAKDNIETEIKKWED